MKQIILLIFLTISLFGGVEKEYILTVMESKINQSMKIAAQKELSSQAKAEKIFPIFEDIFDYGLMTKLSLGKENWSLMTQEQREEFTTHFISHLKNSYVDKIGLYTDEKLNIIELKEVNKKRVWLLTQFVGSKDTYDVTYKFHKSKNDGWLIYDVDIIGISLIQIYRAQFKNMMQKESFEALLSKVKSKQ